MKPTPVFLAFAAVLSSTLAAPAPASPPEKRANPQGVDISHYQGTVNFNTLKSNGLSFVYIKATEGTTYTDPMFSTNYDGATSAGLIRGAYHFAHPDTSSGAVQANAPSGNECYGLSASAMVSWIKDFSNTYHSSVGVYPVIYTTTDWWTSCTGNSASFASTNPLWIARYSSSIGTLPAGWSYTTFWQYADSGANPGDQDEFNGSAQGLKNLALG
ncbi:glycoside hydrolase family 25 protein [Epithele typhae]|uniref:glycoside hydrolase family 25 protein n=1 Tax=Epithele typhae TaxID=378194 RepID=UPI0020080D56|nr:glycoside hydrolase family 25 protein [Epithele typhae]KAH9917661.1 glycoside hydrolase family 25 protein [Epithele typhae]